MAPNLLFYHLLLAALVLVCLIMHIWWPDPLSAPPPPPIKPHNSQRKRSQEPKPFTGYIHKPVCEACEHGLDSALQPHLAENYCKPLRRKLGSQK